MEIQTRTPAKFSVPSLIAIGCAIASFPAGAFFGFVLAAIAVLFGAIGIILAFSSRTRGGIISALSIFAGILGLVAAVIKGIAWLL